MNDSTQEIWVDVPGFYGLYQVSNTGKIKTIDRPTKHNYGGIAIKKSRIMKLTSNNGYLGSRFNKDGKYKQFLVHRIVALAFMHNPENKPCVNHKDGDKANNNVGNLEWCTYLENQTHADATGLRNIVGENNGRAKLSIEDVSIIRNLCKSESSLEIAKRFGVTQQNINSIKKNKSWVV